MILNSPTLYNQASYALGEGQIVKGDTIDFSLTIPETNKNIDGSIAFVKFLLSEEGMDLLEKYGLKPDQSRRRRRG